MLINNLGIICLLQILPYASLNKVSNDEIKSMLDQLVVVKMNGGLGM